MHSYKNTSMGKGEKGDSGPKYSHIGHVSDPKPPAGESNSYEKARKALDSKDTSAMHKKHYTREKMSNK